MDQQFGIRFGREIDASRRVSGAYTAAVMDADPLADPPWLVSVYVPGPTLQDAVAEHGPLSVPAVRRLAVGVALALADIHRAGLLHRDLKEDTLVMIDLFAARHDTFTIFQPLSSWLTPTNLFVPAHFIDIIDILLAINPDSL